MKNTPLHIVVVVLCFNLCEVRGQSAELQVSSHLSLLQQRGELTEGDSFFEISSEHISSVSGLHHIYYDQVIDGITILGTSSSLHMNSENKIVATHANFISNSKEKLLHTNQPTMTPLQVVNRVTQQLNYPIAKKLVAQHYDSETGRTTISRAAFFRKDILVEERYLIVDNESITSVYQFEIHEPDDRFVWQIVADANTGELLRKENLVALCNFGPKPSSEETILNYNFNVYPPEENPMAMETAIAGCTECYEVIPMPFSDPYETERTIVESPAHLNSSPYGWHDVNGEPGAEFTNTAGNNTETIEGGDNEGYKADGGVDLNFTGFEFDEEWSIENQYEDASLTNLFYWTNIAHDVFYTYGFDEKAGNFQWNNYGRGGEEKDFVIANAQASEWCNAAYYTPVDGEMSRMSMYICHNMDGAFDATVILHEMTHGLARRLIGGANRLGCTANDDRFEEGLCDWFGAVLTIKENDTGAKPRGIANYLFGYGNEGPGIRPYPYSTDMNINPHTYGDTREMESIHHIGSVWGVILWEMTWSLIEEFGFDANIHNFTGKVEQDSGNIIALAIVTEALKLLPCRGGFKDFRDAIFRASRQIYGGQPECALWRAFSKRGMGTYATQGDPNDVSDNFESFKTVPQEATYNGLFDLCDTSDILYEQYGGNPFGGVYSGPGVTDDGNGLTFTFDPAEAGIGTHTITYTIAASECTIPSSDSGTVTIRKDVEPPMMECPEFITVLVDDFDGYAEVPSLARLITVSDDCTYNPKLDQDPDMGDLVDKNVLNYVTLTATDNAGNFEQCRVRLFFASRFPDPNLDLQLYPNPNTGQLFIRKRTIDKLKTAMVYDARGRLVKSYDLSNLEVQSELNIESLVSGVYFIRFDFERDVIVKQLIRE